MLASPASCYVIELPPSYSCSCSVLQTAKRPIHFRPCRTGTPADTTLLRDRRAVALFGPANHLHALAPVSPLPIQALTGVEKGMYGACVGEKRLLKIVSQGGQAHRLPNTTQTPPSVGVCLSGQCAECLTVTVAAQLDKLSSSETKKGVQVKPGRSIRWPLLHSADLSHSFT